MQFICFFVFFVFSLAADWNEDFDQASLQLQESLPQFQDPEYLEQYARFQEVREEILGNRKLVNKIKNYTPHDKVRVKIGDFLIKKRRYNQINDLFPWELSYLLGGNENIVPSFPMKVGNTLIILQPYEHLHVGKKETKGFSKDLIKKVELAHYWKALLQAYVLGLSDLHASNISISKGGIIRFFDTEGNFKYNNTPKKKSVGLRAGFICHALDWPQYRKPMSRSVAEEVAAFAEGFLGFDEYLEIYLSLRPREVDWEGLKERLEMVRNFPFEEGTTFEDFFHYLYPKMAAGLNQLSRMMTGVLGHKAGPGSGLLFIQRKSRISTYKSKDQKRINSWLKTYTGKN